MMSVEKPEQPHHSTILDKTSKAFNRGFSTIHVRSNKEEKECDGDAKDFSEFAKQFAVSDAHMNGTKKPTSSPKPVALSTDHTSKLRDKKRHSWGGAAFQAVLGPREKGNPNKLDTIFEERPESSEAATQAGENTETATGKKEKKPKGKKGKKKDKSHNTEKSPKQPKKRKNSKDTITSHEEIAPLPRRRRSESSGSRLRNSSSNPEVGMKSLKLNLKKSDENEDKDDNEKQGTGRDKDKKQEKKQKEKRDKELEKERKEKEKKERELEREQERRRDREKRDAEKKKSALRRLSIGRSNRGTVKKTILAASHNEIPLARTEGVDDLIMMKRLAPDINASDPGIVVTNKWRRNTFHAGDVGGNQAFLALLFNQPPPPEDGGGEVAAGKQGEGKEAGGARAGTPPPDSARAKPANEAGNTPEADAKSAEEEKRAQEENRQLDIEIMKEKERLSAVENEIQELMRQTAAKQPRRKRSAPASMQTSVVELILTPPTPRSLSGGSIEEERPNSISSQEELLVPATIVQGE